MFGNLFKKKQCSDELVIIALKNNGSNLDKPHVVDFLLDFDNAQSARAIAEDLSGNGFSSQILLSDDGELFTCKASKELIPELSAMRSLTKELSSLAQQHGGVYDGWGAEVVE